MEPASRIKACSKCGSTDLAWVGGSSNAVFDFTGATALSGVMHCNGCGSNVLPISFKSQAEYKKFAKALKEQPEAPEGQTKMRSLRKQSAGEGVNLARGYVAWAALGLGIGAILILFLAIMDGSICGIAVALAFAALAVFFYTRSRKRVLKQEERK